MLGIWTLEKLFNKCIMINKWYYKTIVLNIGPRLRPPGWPARARSVRPEAVCDHPLGPSRSRPLASARLRAPRPPWTRTCKNLQLKQIQTCLTRSEKLKKHGEITSSMVKLQYLVIQFIHISYAEHSRRHSTKKGFTLSILKIEKSASSASNEPLFEALQLVKRVPLNPVLDRVCWKSV